ncbi:hypothetical protein KL929_002833 [Ogataea haglerorum]|uniref:uncharacterized protein n=1 Tax=Ogataea haglerorum TaxID=1937702 RepID=UPI001C896657|nr:uncharacterized protein KL911_003716 [Ogataea haglerorum]KAG7698537.1 hypothetical protein KL951_001801 [Ogataea haglerorum]KAG7728862.1 hypothetical protein KL948_003899 [Ogataea haglerorum]KAG7737927.1 hypothetical protein KL923_003474 [Ogataea haglerorum]KAG7747098.1 hypothetical protein KL912_003710 [Ogataea haglerorum]KAG7752434.1 hypothetical protein KL911_003716 [Ogataea haglerorum]
MSPNVLHNIPAIASEASSATLHFDPGIELGLRGEKPLISGASTPSKKPTPSPHNGSKQVVDQGMKQLARELKYREFFKRSPKSPNKGFSKFFLSQELSPYDKTSDDSSIADDTSASIDEDTEQHYKEKPRRHGLASSYARKTTHEHANFILTFSKDGKYMASGGDDGVVRVWKVITSSFDREIPEIARNKSFNGHHLNLPFEESDSISIGGCSTINDSVESLGNTENGSNRCNPCPGKKSKKDKQGGSTPFAPLFMHRPVREFHHDDTVLSIDWSENGFIISCSQDSTIKLWHVDRNDCLAAFKLKNFATRVLFHKKDDRFFLSCQLDGSVKLWSILEKDVVLKTNVRMRITCMEFSPSAEELFVGGEIGGFVILSVKDLDVIDKFQIKRNNVAPRVTGIDAFETKDDVKMVVTTNDSRVRLFSFREKVLNVRYKGYNNEHSTIRASVNENHSFIISGSEDGWAYLWALDLNALKSPETMKGSHKLTWDLTSLFKDENCRHKNKNYGAFHVHHSRCNVAIFAPKATLKLLELSNDPIFDLKARMSLGTTTKKGDDELDDPSTSIIVTTDDDGVIRVFRRDFAYQERKAFRTNLKKFGGKHDRKSLSKVRNRSRSSSFMNKANSLNRGNINGGDENDRGRKDFRHSEFLATRGALCSPKRDKSLSASKDEIAKLPASEAASDGTLFDSKVRSIDVKLQEMLASSRLEDRHVPIISTTDENDSSLRNDNEAANSVSMHGRETFQETTNGDQDEETSDSIVTSESVKSRVQCANCGSEKFTARSHGDTRSNIFFFCDDCGQKVDL